MLGPSWKFPGRCRLVPVGPGLEGIGRRCVNNKGFTLIEMLMAIAIMGILVAVAYPSYQNSTRKARRADGIAAALTVQVAQERFRGNCRFYAKTIGGADVCGANATASTVASVSTSNEGFYTLSIEGTPTGNSYVILIDPTGNQAADTDCNPMRLTFNNLNPNGLKSPADCW